MSEEAEGPEVEEEIEDVVLQTPLNLHEEGGIPPEEWTVWPVSDYDFLDRPSPLHFDEEGNLRDVLGNLVHCSVGYYLDPSTSAVSDQKSDGAVAWVDIVPSEKEGRAEVLEHLTFLAGSDEIGEHLDDLATDLASVDEWPEVHRYGSVRKLSVTAVLSHGEAATRREQTTVFAARVEIAVGENWVLSAWHPIGLITKMEGEDRAPQGLWPVREELHSKVRSTAHAYGFKKSGDLALAILGATVSSFSPKRRDAHQSLDDWEVEFYRDKLGSRAKQQVSGDDTVRLAEIHSAAVALSRQLEHLSAPRERAASHWVGSDHVSGAGKDYASLIDEKIDRYGLSLRDLRDRVRAGLEMSHNVLSAARDEESRQHDLESRERDSFIAKLAAVFLAPTLVAGFYGINTKYPDSGTVRGTIEAVVLMVLSAVIAWAGIKWFERKKEQEEQEHGH